MQSEPTKEHKWLAQLAGTWTMEGECSMGPDQPPMKSSGTETVRMLGELWAIGEGAGDMAEGAQMQSILTIGFDPARGKFVGSWIGSPMANMFIYEGTLDDAGRVLTLDTEGPSFADPTKTGRYQDIVELCEDGTRQLRSQMLGDDGAWHPFMKATYRRTGG